MRFVKKRPHGLVFFWMSACLSFSLVVRILLLDKLSGHFVKCICMEYIPRLAEDILRELLKSPKVVIILGARQVGKTTLVGRILNELKGVIVNLDIEVDKSRFLLAANLTPQEAIKTLGSPPLLVIDEAQRLPEVGRIVKGWYDAKVQTKIVLLGSSSLNLLDQAAESLTGRNEKLYLPPLLFSEVLRNASWYTPGVDPRLLAKSFSAQMKTLLLQRMVFGSYPETVVTIDKESYLINLVSDYLLKDILQLGLVKSPAIVRKLLMLLAYQAGSEVSISELSSNLQIARPTVERYLALLEQTFVIFRLPAFSSNLRKEIVKNQKIFFWDTGIRNALLKELTPSEYRADLGALFENFVIAEFAKKNLLEGQKFNLYFWRTRDGSEVDLVVKGCNLFRAYEIKWSKTQLVGGRAFTNKYGIKVELINQNSFLDFLW